MLVRVINGANPISEVDLLIPLSHDAMSAAEDEAARIIHKQLVLAILLIIPANQGSDCLFVPIMLYMKWKNNHKYHNNCLKNLKFGFKGFFCISGIKIFLNQTVYELYPLPYSLLPTLRHETAVPIKQLQMLNWHHLLPLPTSNIDWN